MAVHILQHHGILRQVRIAHIPSKLCSQLNDNTPCSGIWPETGSESCFLPPVCVLVAPALTESQCPGSEGCYNCTKLSGSFFCCGSDLAKGCLGASGMQ